MKSTYPNNPQTTGDKPVAIQSASPPRRLLLGYVMAAIVCLSTSLHAAISVGDSGSGTNDFSATPAATEWATLSWAGGLTDVTDAATMDTAVSALTASSISTTLGTSSTNPPSANVLARRNMASNLLQMRPNGTKGCLLMATLQNTNSSGNDVTKLQISYDFGHDENAVEELEGVRAYYSMTGLAGSWTAIPDLCAATAGSLSTVVTLHSKWAPGAKLYVLWADDDASGTDDANTIDNVSFTINEVAPSANMLTFDFGAPYGLGTINGTNISIQVLSSNLTLAPTYTLSAGASCDVASGYSQDFSAPVRFTVQSSDLLVTKVYTVTVLGHPMITARSDGKTVAAFNVVGNHTWTVPPGVASVEVLVVGGGGGAGNNTGGGGAGGLYTSGTFAVTSSSNVSVSVGGGGGGGNAGTAGGNSSFDTLIAYGGAAGATTGGNSGGNNQGGTGFAGGTTQGGGGGAGQAGQNNWYSAPNNNGGNGVEVAIIGTPTYYGGGGATYYNGSKGGLGGGGSTLDATPPGNPNGVSGLGGGAAAGRGVAGGSGGSGMVIVAYQPATKTLTTTELVSSDDTSLNGQIVTFTATLKVGGVVATTATGIYEFKVDGVIAEAAGAITGGVATFTTDTFTPGAHTVTANYSGDAAFEVSTASITQTNVTPATTTALVSDDDTSITGQTVWFTATVKVGETVATEATGTIQFKVDGVSVTTENVVNGTASYSTHSFAPGVHSIAAIYSGDTLHLTSTGTLTQTNVTPLMLTFSFPGFDAATITGNNIAITLPPGTVVTSLAPTYTHVGGATGDPVSASSHDFTLPVSYTLTSTVDPLVSTVYTVTVTVPPHPMVTTRGDGYTVVAYSLVGDYTWAVPAGVTSVEVLAVGGGGAGSRGGAFGNNPNPGGGSPGGGAGGLYCTASYAVTGGSTVNLTVGAGASVTTATGDGVSGSQSVFGQIIAYGGQGAQYLANQGGNQGGSSTDGGLNNTAGYLGGIGSGATGGAGAGENGSNGVFGGAYGGSGVSYSITGASIGYAGGGSAGYTGTGLGHGALFGGGEGSGPENTPGTSGVHGLGGGGGGGRGANGGGGGSGAVIVAYIVGGSSGYLTWAAGPFAHAFNDTNPANDPDNDGQTNQQEFAFGLDPTSGASVNPISGPLNQSSHKFSYTRYAASGLTYTVWTSADLQGWEMVLPVDMTENAGTPNGAGVATVEVTLTKPPVGDKLFVRVQAE